MVERSECLSSVYSNKTISAVIDEAINLNYKLIFIDMQGNDRELTRGHLATIKAAGADNKAVIYTPNPAGKSFYSVRHVLGYSELRAHKLVFDQIRKDFGEGDKDQNSTVCIVPLGPKEKEDRKQQIGKATSFAKRSEEIEQRGYAVYAELEKTYRAKFNKEVIAEFIQQEEKPLYEAFGKDLPHVKSYLKHIRTPTKKAEYSE